MAKRDNSNELGSSVTRGPSSGFQKIDSLREALLGEKFPLQKVDLYYSIGDMTVADVHGHGVAIRDVLPYIHQQHFESAEDAVSAIREHIDQAAHPDTELKH